MRTAGKSRTMGATEDPIQVSPVAGGKQEAGQAVPSHWADSSGKSFKNPWPSFRVQSAWDVFKVRYCIAISISAGSSS